ncbi:hypothetical protein [Sphingomonas sp.]|uniref:hypothetical protein n=1 Tax=Sphingomonas sp. TaxID=28214 RepID=UPI003CC67B8F
MTLPGWGEGTGDAFDVVLVGDAEPMAAAVALAGGRVVARLGWDAVATADATALVAVELDGGAAALSALAGLAGWADLVTCGLDQLDAVADAVLFSDAQLLCAPTLAERVEALALAAAQGHAPEAAVREGDAARLRRFSGEVARIAGVLARLATAEGGPKADGVLADRRPAYDPGPASGVPANPKLVRAAIRARRLRAQYFGDGLFEDPAWDMLLDLYAAELEGGRVSVSSLCIAAQVAPTTALRWIGRLTAEGLFERRPDPQDRRRAFVALSGRASATMRAYVAALERTGLSLG